MHRLNKILNSTAVRVAAVVMIIFSIGCFVFLQLRKNDLESQIELLQMKKAEMNEVIYSLEAEIARPFDEEYIAEIAHEQLGLCYPQEIIFISGD